MMDLNNVMKTLLSADSVKNLSQVTGTTQKDVKSVLNSALPMLLNGVSEQAADKKTAASLAGALAQHAKDDTRDLSSFLGKVDMKDGAKIIAHLLGGKTETATAQVAQDSGVSANKTAKILSAVAPLLMSLLGQQTGAGKDDKFDVGDLVGAVLSNVDVGSLLTGLLRDDDEKDNKKDDKKDGGLDLGDVAGLLGNLLK